MKNRNILTRGLFAFAAFAVFCGAAAVVTKAQSNEQYTISAKAGGVNSVSGDVTVSRRGATGRRQLTPSDELDGGDVVTTGTAGRVEVLLSPGSYLRAAEGSEFELTDSSLDSLRVRLLKGSAVVEAAGADGARLFLEVSTPQAKVVIDRKGLYRVNLLPGGATEVLVRKGQALVGSDSSTTVKVKDGKKAVVGGGGEVSTAKFDKKQQDAFDLWSGRRAEELASASRKLSDDARRRSYAGYRGGGLRGRRDYGSLAGLWVYDPSHSYRTFLPFYGGWSSPYGHGYSTGFGFPSHRHGLFNLGSGGGHNSRHRSDHVSNTPHSGRSHHQSTTHRSSSHHRRGH